MEQPRPRWLANPWRPAAELLAAVLPWRHLFDKKHWDVWERAGFHVVSAHFYTPLWQTEDLKPSLWDWRSRSLPFDLRAEAQLRLLADLRRYQPEYAKLANLANPIDGGRIGDGGGFGPVDAELLYALVRCLRPKRIVEVGSGVSTWVAASASTENHRHGSPGTLTAIEPYPAPALERGIPGLTKLIRKKLQDVDVDVFRELGAGDVLFIDSSHVHKLGSDVQHLFSNVIPALAPGVYVHFHDIFTPSEYPERWVREKRLFWNEQHILESFLAFNAEFEVVLGASYLHLAHQRLLEAAFPSYDPSVHWPGSFWIRRRPRAR
jgi:predicted O-methyltransferase YrrM